MNYIHDWFRSRGMTNVMLKVDLENGIDHHFWVRWGNVSYATQMKKQLAI